MKYFIDTEFHEYQKKPFLGKPVDTIELISIGIVSQSRKEYYAICSDFDIKAAWYDHNLIINRAYPQGPEYFKEYWLRENVLRPIFVELVEKWAAQEYKANQMSATTGYNPPIKFNLRNFKKLIKKYGKPREKIKEEILEYMSPDVNCGSCLNPEFYAYYADYDWVNFCWIFGRMVDLPKNFPMFCIDLKQMMWERGLDSEWKNRVCPDPEGEHNAAADARWNMDLHFQITMPKLTPDAWK